MYESEDTLGATASLEPVIEVGLECIGLRASTHRVDVYIDRSPGRHQRDHSHICQTRDRMRCHRRRDRTQDSVAEISSPAPRVVALQQRDIVSLDGMMDSESPPG